MFVKEKFINIVVSTICEHPDWMADTINAMQAGMMEKLDIEMTAKSNIAYMAVTLMEKSPKVVEKYKHNIRLGLMALYQFFRRAPCHEEIAKYLEEESDEDD